MYTFSQMEISSLTTKTPPESKSVLHRIQDMIIDEVLASNGKIKDIQTLAKNVKCVFGVEFDKTMFIEAVKNTLKNGENEIDGKYFTLKYTQKSVRY